MKKVYALLTRQCNLSCPHCDIRSIEDNFNRDKFMEQLKQFDGRIVLFGGEPTLHQDRLMDIYYSNEDIRKKIDTISTNLINMNDEIIKLIKDIGSIGTSWNPHRFTDEQYKIWLRHLDVLADNDIVTIVLVTLTDDLFQIEPSDFIKMVKTWNSKSIDYIRFESLVADNLTPEHYEKADNWLCELYKQWDCDIKIETFSLYSWYYDCNGVYTLLPDGTLLNQCPNYRPASTPIECYSCDRANKCRPCMLQDYCNYPKKFAKLVFEKEGKLNEK